MMIYDYSEGFRNAAVMVADSGELYFTDDKKFLLFRLYSGESFENLDRNQQKATHSEKNIPYRRESFAQKQMLIDFNMEFDRYNEDVLSDQHVSKDVVELIESIDSVQVLAHERSHEQSTQMVNNRYFGRDRVEARQVDIFEGEKARYADYEIDSLYSRFSQDERFRALNVAVERAKAQRDQVDYNALMLNDYQRYIRKHEIELHRKFTLAFACLIFFFIGAPLGAITRKGGLGAPVVISVVMFIIYYIIDNTGYKMAREALWPCWSGMWLSSFVLLPIGVFLTYTAATDSPLFNPEAWVKIFLKCKQYALIAARKIYKYIRKKN
jgi:lipopolysaccharide export system permease protein